MMQRRQKGQKRNQISKHEANEIAERYWRKRAVVERRKKQHVKRRVAEMLNCQKNSP